MHDFQFIGFVRKPLAQRLLDAPLPMDRGEVDCVPMANLVDRRGMDRRNRNRAIFARPAAEPTTGMRYTLVFSCNRMKQVSLTTDGACIGNPGAGGWACILRYKEQARELVGSEPHTTNNRMELRAVLAGLSALKEPCGVVVRTDSQYLKNGMTRWIHKWKKQGWVHSVRGCGKQPIKNRDLWEALEETAKKHTITWEWVKGHASDADNNRCDQLATKAARANGRPDREGSRPASTVHAAMAAIVRSDSRRSLRPPDRASARQSAKPQG